MKPIFIINSNACNGKIKKSINELIHLFRQNFYDFNYLITTNEYEIARYLNFISEHDVIVAVGGDGTINNIVNNTIDLNKPYGIIPHGSGNDFIYSLNIPKNINECINIIKGKNILKIDIGRVITEKFNQYFLNAVGIGFDAMVASYTNKINFVDGKIKYYISLLRSLFSYKYYNINLTIDENFHHVLKPFIITIGNGKRTGGAFLLTPNAELNDKIFQVCLVKKVSIYKIIKSLPKVLKGTHYSINEVKLFNAISLIAKSNNELFIHLDGETPNKVKNIQISLIPNKIGIIVP